MRGRKAIDHRAARPKTLSVSPALCYTTSMGDRSLAQSIGGAVNFFRGAVSRVWKWEARFKGVTTEGRLYLSGRPIISRARGSNLILGDGVVLCSALRSNPLACFQPCVLRTLAAGATLRLEQNVGLSGTVLCAGNSIRIGEGTIFGSGAMVLDNDFHVPEGEWSWRTEHVRNAQPVVIGRGVFVGARAIILKGVSIGDRAVIGAGAVVTHDVPPGAVAAGNPARIVRDTRKGRE